MSDTGDTSQVSTGSAGIVTNPFLIIGGSISFIVGLAWSDAVSSTIKYYYRLDIRKGLTAKLVYAIVVTLVMILLAMLLQYLYMKTENISAAELQNETYSIGNKIKTNLAYSVVFVISVILLGIIARYIYVNNTHV